MRASQQAHDDQVTHNQAIIQGTAAAKASQVAMKGLALAGNILTPMLLGAVVSHVAGWIDDMVHKSDKLIEKANEAKEAVSSIANSMDSAKKLVSESDESYAELASKVDPTTNKNVSLSSEEYEKYLDLCSQLAETFPELIRGYDTEGNAMLNLGDNAAETAERLQELYKQKQLMANLDIAEKLPDVFKGYQEKIKKFDEEEAQLDADIQNYQTGSSEVAGKVEFTNNSLSVSETLPNANEIISEVQRVMYDLGIDFSKLHFETIEQSGDLVTYMKGFSLTDKELLEVKKNLSSDTEKIFSSYAGTLDKLQKQKKALDAKRIAEWQSTTPTVLASLATYEDYSSLSEEMQAKINQIVTGLDPSALPLETYDDDIEDFVYMTFLQPFADPETKEEVTRLFSELMEIDTSKITEENKKKLDQIIPELCQYLNLTEDQLKSSLGLENYDTLYQNKETLNAKAKYTATEYTSGHEVFDKNGYSLFTGALDSINTQDEIALLAKCVEETENLTSAVTKYTQIKQEAAGIDLSPSMAAENLSDIEKHMDKFQSVYQEFSEFGKEGISGDSLSSLIDGFSEIEGLSMDEFISVLYSTSSTAEEVEAAFQSLASEYLDSTGILNSLTEENKDLIATQLEGMGFANASELVNQRLAASVSNLSVSEELLKYKSLALFAASTDVTNQSTNAANAFLNQAVMSDYAKTALAELVAQEQIFSNTTLDSQSKINALYNMTNAYFGAAAAASFYNQVNGGMNSSYRISPEQAYQNILNQYGTKDDPETNYFKDKQQKSPPSSNKNTGGGSPSAAKTPTPQIYDWIEKKLSAVADQTERAGKAFDKSFSISSSRRKFTEYLAQINEELKTNSSAADHYQQKMNEVGLSDELTEKVKNGSFDIESISDETLKKKISEFESYYGKWKKCHDSITSLEDKRAQAQKTYADKMIAYHEKEIQRTEKLISRRKALISLKEAFGFSATRKDYSFQQNKSAVELSKVKKHNASLKSLQKTTHKGSEAWKTYQEQMEKNIESSRELTQTIVDLAVEMASLPTEKLDKFLQKNSQKNELYEAKIAASGDSKQKGTWIGSQIKLVRKDRKETKKTADQTSKNLENSISRLDTAKKKDKKKQSKSGKKQVENYYKKIKGYVGKNRVIPASLISKLANAGMDQLVRAASNYNASLAANETAQAAAQLSAETSKKEIAELAVKRFQNTQNTYEQQQNSISRRSEYLSSAISLAESKGHLADQSYYDAQIFLEKENQKSLLAERKKLQNMLNTAVASGNIEQFSEEWLEMSDSIYSVDQALTQSKQTLQDYQNQLQQINFDHFDYLQEQISRLIEEADFYINVMADKPLTNDTGLTEHGAAAIGLHYQKSEVYQNQAAQYKQEIDKLSKEIAQDPTNTTLISQLQNYQDLQKECIQNAQHEKQAIADLVKEGYQALIDSLSKSISKYKEFLQNAKNAHEYQKNISQQTENINTLKKQINAYASMTDSEESSAKLQQLMKELEDAESSLNDTMYDKYLSDTQDAMDDMVNNLEEFLSELSQDTDRLIEDGIETITKSTDAISDTLSSLSAEYNTSLSNAMAASWGTYGNAAGGVNAIISSFQNLLAGIDEKNDAQAYQDASQIYQNYHSFDAAISNAQNTQNALKEKRKTANEEKEQAEKNMKQAKKEMEQAEKKGKNSKQYKNAKKKYDKAKAAYDEKKAAYSKANKAFQTAKQNTTDLKSKQEAAKVSDKSIVQDFLAAIADTSPAKPSENMDALDHAILAITGGYITDSNRKQIMDLLGVSNVSQVVDVLNNLGLITAGVPNISQPNSGQAGTGSYQRLENQLDQNSYKNVKPRPVQEFAGKINPDEIYWSSRIINESFLGQLSLEDIFSNQPPSRISEIGNFSISTGDLLLPDVTNPSEFASGMVNALKNDPTVQRTLGTLLNASLTHGNSLSTQKY